MRAGKNLYTLHRGNNFTRIRYFTETN